MSIYSYPKARDFKSAQPHILRNRIERYQYELRFALPANVPTSKPSAIVPYEKPRAAKRTVTPDVICLPAPVQPTILNRQQRADTFAAALNDPNFRAEDLMNLSTALLKQSALAAYYGETA